MSELNPSEAQRKAMAEVGASGSTGGWSDRVDDWLPVVHRMIAAANKVSEGAPVGTIARRPDGVFVAVRILTDYLERYWTYTCTDHSLNEDWPDPDDADSWPVIPDPTTNVAALLRQAAARLTELSTDETDNYHLVNDLVDAANRIDPTAQQEPERPASEVWQEIAKRWAERRPKPARTPRVVDRLGVDEQGAEWTRREVSRDTYVWEYRFRDDVWQFRLIGHEKWTRLQPGREPQAPGPFTEVLDVG